MTLDNQQPARDKEPPPRDGEQSLRQRILGPTRADAYRYQETRRESVKGRDVVVIDKTMAAVLGALASAGLAFAVAAGSSLVQKVDDTARDVERGRAQRIADFAEASKNILVVETKVNQLTSHMASLEARTERDVDHELQLRDRRLDDLERDVEQLRSDLFTTYRRRKK